MSIGAIILIAISAVWLVSEIALARTKRSQKTDEQFEQSSPRLLWLVIFLAVNGGVFVGVRGIGHIEAGSGIFSLAGLALILCGLVFRWVAILTLRKQFTVDVAITQEHRLVTEGIYRFIRHPAYTGSLLSFLGLGLAFSNWLSVLIIFVPICCVFLYRIQVEEKVLLIAFGSEYADYCASTRRLIPRIF